MTAFLTVVAQSMLGMSGPSEVAIWKIVTRYPNFEVGFLAAILTIRRVRENLNIAANFVWEFRNNPYGEDELVRQMLEQQGVVFFNYGGGRWDSHGNALNLGNCLCSLDLVRMAYDFLRRRTWLGEIFIRVQKNDISGTATSDAENNLRYLMAGLTPVLTAEQMLDFLRLGFLGVMHQVRHGYHKAGFDINAAFGLEEMLKGLQACASPGRYGYFKALVMGDEEAIKQHAAKQPVERKKLGALTIIKEAEAEAKRDLKRAIANKKIWVVKHPGLLRPIVVIAVYSDSNRVDKIARRWGFDVCIVKRKSGNCQVFTRDIREYEGAQLEEAVPQDVLESGNFQKIKAALDKYAREHKDDKIVAKWRIDVGAVIAELRFLEANIRQPKQYLTEVPLTAEIPALIKQFDRLAERLEKEPGKGKGVWAWLGHIRECLTEFQGKLDAEKWLPGVIAEWQAVETAFAAVNIQRDTYEWNDAVKAEVEACRQSLRALKLAVNKVFWRKEGFVSFKGQDGKLCPWFKPPFATMAANGTETFPIEITQIGHDKVAQTVVAYLPECQLLRAEVGDDGVDGTFVLVVIPAAQP